MQSFNIDQSTAGGPLTLLPDQGFALSSEVHRTYLNNIFFQIQQS